MDAKHLGFAYWLNCGFQTRKQPSPVDEQPLPYTLIESKPKAENHFRANICILGNFSCSVGPLLIQMGRNLGYAIENNGLILYTLKGSIFCI